VDVFGDTVYMPPPAIRSGGIMCSGFRPAVRPSVVRPVSREAISLYSVQRFQWNLSWIFIGWVAIAEKVFTFFEVRGQKSRSRRRHAFCRCGVMGHLLRWSPDQDRPTEQGRRDIAPFYMLRNL